MTQEFRSERQGKSCTATRHRARQRNVKLFQTINGAVDVDNINDLVARNRLAQEGLDPAAIRGVRTIEAEVGDRVQTAKGNALALRVVRATGPGAPERGRVVERTAEAVAARGCFRAPWADEALGLFGPVDSATFKTTVHDRLSMPLATLDRALVVVARSAGIDTPAIVRFR